MSGGFVVRRSGLLALAFASTALLASAGGADAAPAGWSSPQDLSDTFEVGEQEGSAFNYPDVDVSPTGDAVAVWQRNDQMFTQDVTSQVWFAERPLGGVWSAARLLGSGSGPHVGTNGGSTVVTWSSGANIVARVRRGAGDFAAARNFGAGAEPQAGVDDSGAATVLWSGGGVDYGIRSARNTAAAGWTATKTISFSPTAQNPDLAVSGGGDAIATWKAQDGVRLTEFTSSGGWSAHHLFAPGGERPSIAVNRGGQVVLAWSLPVTTGTPTESAYASTGTIRGGLGPGTKISPDVIVDSTFQQIHPETSLGTRGDAVVAWNLAILGTGLVPESTVQVASSRLPFGWTNPQSISVPVYVPQPSVGVLPDGSAIVAWRGGSAAVRAADQADISPQRWDPPVVLSDPGADVYNPDLAVDAAGGVHAVWADASRPRQRFEDHLAAMAVQATSFGLPGSTPVPLSPAVPAPPGPSAGGAPIAAGVGRARPRPPVTPKNLPTPGVTTVIKRGTLYLKVTTTLSKQFKGRSLVIQRLVGRKVLPLASLKVPASGRISRLIALDIYSKAGGAGVRGVARVKVRIALTRTKKAAAIASPFRTAGI